MELREHGRVVDDPHPLGVAQRRWSLLQHRFNEGSAFVSCRVCAATARGCSGADQRIGLRVDDRSNEARRTLGGTNVFDLRLDLGRRTLLFGNEKQASVAC